MTTSVVRFLCRVPDREGEELAEVTELLEEEIAERHRLEAEIAQRGMSENG